MANSRKTLGGVVHTYQKFNPAEFPSPTAAPPDVLGNAFDLALSYGSQRELSEEELARAIRLDPSQIANLGPTLDQMKAMLEERKRRILEKYETDTVQAKAKTVFEKTAKRANPPSSLRKEFQHAVQNQQIYLLERLWYRADRDSRDFAVELLQVMERLGDKYHRRARIQVHVLWTRATNDPRGS
jgi:hypothetical protein